MTPRRPPLPDLPAPLAGRLSRLRDRAADPARGRLARRVALREDALARIERRAVELEDGARENVRMLPLLEAEVAALEREVLPLLEAALHDADPGEGPADAGDGSGSG